MLRIACFLTGDNYRLVANDTPASKKKITAMAIAMTVPILIWIFNSFMLSLQVLETGLGWAVLTGITCGFIVFMIEKLIVMANGNGWLTTFRVCIGLIVAALGSIAIDEVVFRKDIDTSVAELKKEAIEKAKKEAAVNFENEKGYADLNKNINEARISYENAEKAVIEEANGTYGTGKRGAGKITELKNRKALERKTELNKLLDQKAKFEEEKINYIKENAAQRMKTFDEKGLLIRVKALFKLVVEDGYMLTVYLLFTALLFFFEFLVVVLKLTWRKTNYERRLELIDEIGSNRIEVLRNRNNQSDLGNYLPQLEAARNAVRKSASVYN